MFEQKTKKLRISQHLTKNACPLGSTKDSSPRLSLALDHNNQLVLGKCTKTSLGQREWGKFIEKSQKNPPKLNQGPALEFVCLVVARATVPGCMMPSYIFILCGL